MLALPELGWPPNPPPPNPGTLANLANRYYVIYEQPLTLINQTWQESISTIAKIVADHQYKPTLAEHLGRCGELLARHQRWNLWVCTISVLIYASSLVLTMPGVLLACLVLSWRKQCEFNALMPRKTQLNCSLLSPHADRDFCCCGLQYLAVPCNA